MKRTCVFSCLALATVVMLTGCDSAPKTTGFLSNYSQLEADGSSLRYLNVRLLSEYDKFIIEPVVVHFHPTADGKGTSAKELSELTIYMRGELVNAIAGAYQVVSQPGPGVARVRVALTDIKKGSPALNILPTTKLTGVGLGNASMEAEVVDSRSGAQIAALVESREGNRLSLAGVTHWGDAKSVMDGWAKRFRERLDEAHGR